MRDQVRVALFNILGNERLAGANVLDLFAGSGSLGLEAISRGARQCVFLERAPECLSAIQKNVVVLGINKKIEIWSENAWADVEKRAEKQLETRPDLASRLGL